MSNGNSSALRELKCGDPDVRRWCTNLFGVCDKKEGESCLRKVGDNNLVYNDCSWGYTCKKNECVRDFSIRCEEDTESSLNFSKELVYSAYAQDSDDLSVNSSGIYKVSGIDTFTTNNEIAIIIDEDGNDKRVAFFNDKNNNGNQDTGEEYIDGAEIKLEKQSDVVTYDLEVGWNLVSFPLALKDVKTAGDLVNQIIKQGGYATHVVKYQNGKWETFSQRLGISYSHDHNIVSGVGYFIRVYQPVKLVLAGNRLERDLPLNLTRGWNLIGIVSNEKNYSAESLINYAVEKGIMADTVSKWDSGRYVSYVNKKENSYGSDFELFDTGGYFVRVREK